MSLPAPVKAAVVRISTTSGSINVVAEAGLTTMWSSIAPLVTEGSSTTIDGGSSKVKVRVPEGTDLVVGATSGRVTIEGRVGSVSAMTTSGRVSIADAGSVDVRTTSGRIDVGRTMSACRAVASSGRVEVGRCGEADVTARSGRIVLKDVHGTARAHCVSGRVDISMGAACDVDAETVSGRIVVSLPPSVRPQIVSSSGDIVDSAETYDCVVVARSGSGRVVVANR
jgi:DUF4097 and DUF4098 domain-containing protein YvlB